MELSNVVLNIPLETGRTVPRAVGEQATDGYELDGSLIFNENLSLLFSVSDIDSLNSQGDPFRGVPQDLNYNFWAKYDFSENSPLEGFYSGIGFRHNGRAAADNGANFFLDKHNTVDGLIGYKRDNWKIQINITNLLNDDSPNQAVSDFATFRKGDRSFNFTGEYRF